MWRHTGIISPLRPYRISRRSSEGLATNEGMLDKFTTETVTVSDAYCSPQKAVLYILEDPRSFYNYNNGQLIARLKSSRVTFDP